jgi:hypothetical protein
MAPTERPLPRLDRGPYWRSLRPWPVSLEFRSMRSKHDLLGRKLKAKSDPSRCDMLEKLRYCPDIVRTR